MRFAHESTNKIDLALVGSAQTAMESIAIQVLTSWLAAIRTTAMGHLRRHADALAQRGVRV